MKLKQHVILFLSSVLIASCSLFSKQSTSTEDSFSGLTVIQNGVRKNIENTTTDLTLKKEAFQLEFESAPYDSKKGKFHAVQIAATQNENNLTYFKEGVISMDNPFYSYMGTGIANERNKPYPAMYIGDSGHHYIYYEDENDHRTEVSFIRKNKNVRMKWEINKVIIDKKEEVNIENAELQKIYLMVFIDKNLNKAIDSDEYSLLNITFN